MLETNYDKAERIGSEPLDDEIQFVPSRIRAYPFRLANRSTVTLLLQKYHSHIEMLKNLADGVLAPYRDWQEERLGGEVARIWKRITVDADQNGDTRGQRLAIYAHYSASSTVSPMVELQLREYSRQGFEIAFVTMCRTLSDDTIKRLGRICRTIILRRSFGRDFGAWRDTIGALVPRPENLSELLLVNDSIIGPIRPLDPIFACIRSAEGLWGLTESAQNGSHLQSYFLLARGSAAVHAICNFFGDLQLTSSKSRTIKRGELAVTSAIRAHGVPIYAVFGVDRLEKVVLHDSIEWTETAAQVGCRVRIPDGKGSAETKALEARIKAAAFLRDFPLNPTHQLAGPLVRKLGFPFLKTELLIKNPARMMIAQTWRDLITRDSPCSIEEIEDHLASL